MNNTVNFQSETGPNTTDRFEYECPADGAITRLYAEAVANEQADVQRRWLVKSRDGDQERNVLVTAASFDYLAGDDSVFDLTVHEEIEEGETLILEVQNTDSTYTYPNIAFAELRFGDLKHLVSALTGLV